MHVRRIASHHRHFTAVEHLAKALRNEVEIDYSARNGDKVSVTHRAEIIEAI